MKKRLFSILMSALLLAVSAIFFACKQNTEEPAPKEEVVDIYFTVTYSSLAGNVPATFQIKEGSAITQEQLPDLTFEGYDFEGWFAGEEQVTAGFIVSKNITFVAKWTPKKFTLSFNANEGTGTTESQSYTYNVKQAIHASNFTAPTGYYFYSWNTKADGTGKTYFPGDKITLDANLTLYAVYVEKGIHKIVYVSFIDCKNTNPDSYKEKDSVEISSPEAVTGYTFEGWYETSDYSTQKVTGWEKGTKTTDVILYAKWVPVSFTVSFDANNGQGSVESQTYEYGVIQGLNENKFTRKGYTFTGWNTKADGTGDSYSNQVAAVFTSTGNIVLYAQWKVIKYTIVYKTEGGYLDDSADLTYNVESENITLKTPSKTGYTFEGWYKTNDYSGDRITSINKGSAEHFVLYAKWSVKSYTVTFKANSGSGNDYTQTYTYEEYKKLTPVAFTKNGYNFTRWDTAAEGNGTSYGDEKYYKVDVYNPSDITLYAIWSIDTYYITYELLTDNPSATNNSANVASFKVETPSITFYSPDRMGYTFDGWYLNYNEESNTFSAPISSITTADSTHNVTVYAKWSPKTTTKYTVNCYVESLYGGYNLNSFDVKEGTTDAYPTDETINSYKEKSITGFTYDTCETETIKGDGTSQMNFYFKRNTIYYKFILGGGHFINPCSVENNEITDKYNQEIKVTDPVLDGSYFNGWLCSADNKIYKSDEITYLGSKNLTYTAVWTKGYIVDISIIPLSDISVTVVREGDKLIFTFTEGFDKYEIYNENSTDQKLTTNSYEEDISTFVPGVYEYFIEAYNVDEENNEIPNSRRNTMVMVRIQ